MNGSLKVARVAVLRFVAASAGLVADAASDALTRRTTPGPGGGNVIDLAAERYHRDVAASMRRHPSGRA